MVLRAVSVLRRHRNIASAPLWLARSVDIVASEALTAYNLAAAAVVAEVCFVLAADLGEALELSSSGQDERDCSY